MLDFQQKRQIKKVIYSRASLITLFLVVVFLARSDYDIYTRQQLSADNYNETKKDYDGLKVREAMLATALGRLKTEVGIEEEIRSKFSVAKPGETVVVVVDSSSTQDNKNQSDSNLWSRFMSWFR